jgi:hypothetical protein
LWREFCATVHQDAATVPRGPSLVDRIRLVFATWNGPVPHRLEADVLKWTPKTQRTWLAKVRRRRVHDAQLREAASHRAPEAPARNPQARLTTFYRRKVVPAQVAQLKQPSLAARGSAFARTTAHLERRRRGRQASLRDMGWSPADLPLHSPVEAPRLHRKKVTPASVARLKRPSPADAHAASARTTSRLERRRQSSLRQVALGPIASPDGGLAAPPSREPPPSPAAAVPESLPPPPPPPLAAPPPPEPPSPHPLLIRAVRPPTARELYTAGCWRDLPDTLPPTTVPYVATDDRPAVITVPNLRPLCSPTAHLGADIYEIFHVVFGVRDGVTPPHTAPYATSYHHAVLAAPADAPLPPRAAWTALYAQAVPVLAGVTAAPGHHGVCIPIHVPGHWVLLVLDLPTATFTVYDSFAARGHPCSTVEAAIGGLQARLSSMAASLSLTIAWQPTVWAQRSGLAQQYDVADPTAPGGDCLLFVACWSVCVIAGVTPDLLTIQQRHMECVRAQLLAAMLDGWRHPCNHPPPMRTQGQENGISPPRRMGPAARGPTNPPFPSPPSDGVTPVRTGATRERRLAPQTFAPSSLLSNTRGSFPLAPRTAPEHSSLPSPTSTSQTVTRNTASDTTPTVELPLAGMAVP